MAAIRLSQLQQRILQLLAADYQRTNGGLSTSHQELVMKLPHDRGNISHSLYQTAFHKLISTWIISRG
jgi:hypothetical protein